MKQGQLDEIYLFLLEKAVRQFRKYSRRKLVDLGFSISAEQWIVLKRLHEQQGMQQNMLASKTYKDPASITRILDSLSKEGYIERKASQSDRRAHHLFLTTKGKKLVERILPHAVEMREKGLYGVSDSDRKALVRALKKIEENFIK